MVLYDPSRNPPENALSGAPVELITAVGRVGTARRTVQVEATRFPLYPNVTAALSANGTCDLRGNVTVCGHNHRIDTPPRTDLPQCSPAWDEATGHLPGVMTTGYDVMRRGSADLLGSPAVVDTSSSNVFYSLSQALGITEAELADILSSPDYTAADRSVYMEGITYIQGDCLATVIDGEGLLYVTGDLTVSGNIEWTGLVYVEGSFRSTGNAWILGAVMVEGDSTIALDFGAGNPSVLYSREALLRALTRCMRYVTLSWRELD